ncbi:MAG: hypothetical protein KQH59_18305 [Desulfobulbaceae bacterium]|nr:hypothetical protein [Desulfobulbaceae bacterium]
MSTAMLCGRPLVFGDAEQIKVLARLEAEAAAAADEQEAIERGELQRYEVHVCAEFDDTVTVLAASAAEAKTMALEEAAEMWNVDFTASIVSVDRGSGSRRQSSARRIAL